MKPGDMVRLAQYKSCETLYSDSNVDCWCGGDVEQSPGIFDTDISVVLDVYRPPNRSATFRVMTSSGKIGWIRGIYLVKIDETR
jgi:hypothetical protein